MIQSPRCHLPLPCLILSARNRKRTAPTANQGRQSVLTTGFNASNELMEQHKPAEEPNACDALTECSSGPLLYNSSGCRLS